MTVAFYLGGLIAVVATAMVITRLNAVHALLYLIVSLLAVAVVFFALGAPFIAALEVIVYAGAIVVLFVFVVMLLNVGPAAARQERAWLEPGIWIGPAILAGLLALVLLWVMGGPSPELVAGAAVGPTEVGLALYGRFALGVELASMLLFAGLIGAYHLGRR